MKNPVFRPSLWQKWSPSKIKLYIDCPRHFLFRYIHMHYYNIVPKVSIYALYGVEMHKKYKYFFDLKNGFISPESFGNTWKFTWDKVCKDNNLRLSSKEDREEKKRKMGLGILMLRAFWRFSKNYRSFYKGKKLISKNSFPVPQTEKETNFNYGGFRLKVRIDRIQGEAIWDYKTGRSRFSKEELSRDLQFTIMQLGYQEKFNKKPSEMKLCVYKNEIKNLDEILLNWKRYMEIKKVNEFVKIWNNYQEMLEVTDKEGKYELIPVPLRTGGDFQDLVGNLQKAEKEIKYAVYKNCDFEKSIFDNPINDCFVTQPGPYCKTCGFEEFCTEITKKQLFETNNLKYRKKSNLKNEQLMLF